MDFSQKQKRARLEEPTAEEIPFPPEITEKVAELKQFLQEYKFKKEAVNHVSLPTIPVVNRRLWSNYE